MHFERVAIVGGSGLLGGYVLKELEGKADLTVVDIRPPAEFACKFVEASMLNAGAMIDALRGCDAVIHLAAIPNPRVAPPDVIFGTNVQGAWNVLAAAEAVGARRVVVASSDAATGLLYNPPGWVPQAFPFDETHPLRPSEHYSLSKEVTETVSKCFAARGKLEVVVIRPTHIIFEPEWRELKARGECPDNYHMWAYVEPSDIAASFRLALEMDRVRYEAFLISAADSLCSEPTLEMIWKRWGRSVKIRNPAVFERNPFASIIDITKARELLGYEPRSNWRKLFERVAPSDRLAVFHNPPQIVAVSAE